MVIWVCAVLSWSRKRLLPDDGRTELIAWEIRESSSQIWHYDPPKYTSPRHVSDPECRRKTTKIDHDDCSATTSLLRSCRLIDYILSTSQTSSTRFNQYASLVTFLECEYRWHSATNTTNHPSAWRPSFPRSFASLLRRYQCSALLRHLVGSQPIRFLPIWPSHEEEDS